MMSRYTVKVMAVYEVSADTMKQAKRDAVTCILHDVLKIDKGQWKEDYPFTYKIWGGWKHEQIREQDKRIEEEIRRNEGRSDKTKLECSFES